MEKKMSIHFNFALLLAIFFVFFALVFLGIGRVHAPSNQTTGQFSTPDEDKILAEKFGSITDGEPEITEDAVLGTQTRWHEGDTSLTINKSQVIYRDDSVIFEKVADSKDLQDKAQEFLNSKDLNGEVILDHAKNKLLDSDGVHFYEVAEGGEADVLEVMFSHIETGEDKIRVKVSGSGEIIEALIIRG